MSLRNAVLIDGLRTLFSRGTRYGLATQCIGAGMGISTLLERLD
jgi:acetyl-CoA acetyltransferase